jgi:recombination protein RecA
MSFNLSDALAITQKTFSSIEAHLLSEAGAFKGTKYRRSGCLALDWILANHSPKGGLARGRVIEVAGPEGSGKTTIATIAAASVQSYPKKNKVLYLDYEHKFDLAYGIALGLKPELTLFSQPSGPSCGEGGLSLMVNAVKAADCGMIVIDSVPAVISRQILEGDIGDANIGANARMWTSALMKVASDLDEFSPTIILINQIRDNIGVMFGSKEKTAGARIIKYNCAARIDVRARDKHEENDEVTSQTIKIKAVKNQLGKPFIEEEIRMTFGEGFENEEWLVARAEAVGVFNKKGVKNPKYIYEQYTYTESQWTEVLKDNPMLLNEIYDLCVQTNQREPASEEPKSKEEPKNLVEEISIEDPSF